MIQDILHNIYAIQKYDTNVLLINFGQEFELNLAD